MGTWVAKFDHILDSINRPDVFADWDSGGGNVWEHKSRQGKVLKEIVVMILVHLGSNVILIYPVWVTASNVNKAHIERILAFPEEKKAKDLLDNLSWVAPLATLLASIVDLVLVVLYQRVFHPWRRILTEEVSSEKNPTYRRTTSTEQYQMYEERMSDRI